MIAGTNYGLVENIKTSGEVNGQMYAGGIVGQNMAIAKIKGIINNAQVGGTYCTGGICGNNVTSSITECENYGAVNGTYGAAGICGQLQGGGAIIDRCCNHGTIYASGSGAPESRSGGLVACLLNDAKILNSYNTGSVSGGNRWQGGLVGQLWYYSGYSACTISNCYNIGEVTGANPKGSITGISYQVNISNCYWTNELGGQGEVRSGVTTTNFEKVSQDTLKTYDTVLGEAFVSDTIGINNGYPILRWQLEER